MKDFRTALVLWIFLLAVIVGNTLAVCARCRTLDGLAKALPAAPSKEALRLSEEIDETWHASLWWMRLSVFHDDTNAMGEAVSALRVYADPAENRPADYAVTREKLLSAIREISRLERLSLWE